MRTMQRLLLLCTLAVMSFGAIAKDKPNILVIWGDDIGQSNISAYTRGLTAKQIDRRVHTIDIAPTLSAYMGIKPPSGAQGNPLIEVLK